MSIRCCHVFLLFFFLLTGSLSSAGKENALLLRAAETHPSSYPTALAISKMGELLQQWSGGTLGIKLYAGGQLGEEKDTLEMTIIGGIDINRISAAPLNSIVPETIVLSMPFLFHSTAHMRRVVDGPIGEEILDSLAPYGLIGLAFYDSGARSFYNNKRPIRELSDLRGLKIRVQNSDIAVAMVSALGANPTPMGFGQVYESLLLGTIDGSENNWPSYESTGHYEAAPYYTLTRHTMTPEILVISKRRWDKLTPEQQTFIRRAAKASVGFMRQQWEARVQVSEQKVRQAGVDIVELDDTAAFLSALSPVYESYLTTPKMQDLWRRIQAESESQ